MTDSRRTESSKPLVMTILGTRPEVIKLAPVLRQLDLFGEEVNSVVVSTGQHRDLIRPMVDLFKIRVDRHLDCMMAGQSLSQLLARCLQAIDGLLETVKPDLVLVQGDTTTALAGALSSFNRRIPIGHVEAGLRTNDPNSPFPEEMNRRLVSRLASWHFATTQRNVDTLLDEGIDPSTVFLTGNPIVDALHYIGLVGTPSQLVKELLDRTTTYKRIVLTTHRRESFGQVLEGNLRVIREFLDRNPGYCVIFPVHPNPVVREAAQSLVQNHPRVFCIEPLNYPDFVHTMSHSHLLVSDSGGIQEEAPTLRKPVIVMREQTERPEAVESGFAKLAPTPNDLRHALDHFVSGSTLPNVENPFGVGDSGIQIVQAIRSRIFRSVARLEPVAT